MNLRDMERESIRRFVQSAADEGYLSGRVLDYGCGKQPYREIVEAAGGEYLPFDRMVFPASTATQDWGGNDIEIGPIDTVLCTQVLQYIEFPDGLLSRLPQLFGGMRGLKLSGHLVLTYPTNWPEVEPEDLHRFTKAGMERILREAGFEVVRHERRAQVAVMIDKDAVMALGYGVIARA